MITQDQAQLSNEVVINLLELERIGYIFLVVGDVVRYLFEGDAPDAAYIRVRLAMIRDHHEPAITFLNNRSKTFDLTAYLVEASNKAIVSARDAEKTGDLKLARREWGRFNRLSAALADHIGEEPDSGISWEDWVKSLSDKPAQVRRIE